MLLIVSLGTKLNRSRSKRFVCSHCISHRNYEVLGNKNYQLLGQVGHVVVILRNNHEVHVTLFQTPTLLGLNQRGR